MKGLAVDHLEACSEPLQAVTARVCVPSETRLVLRTVQTKTGDLLDAKALDQQPPLIGSSIPAQKMHPPAQRATLGLVDGDWAEAREKLLLLPTAEAGVVWSKQLPQARKVGGVPEGEISGEFALNRVMSDDRVCED